MSSQLEQKIEEQIDLTKACVHCGMCLSSCPTYLVTSNEGNSPRGRLYMIRDLLEQEKSGSLGFETQSDQNQIEYLDNCLNCRACETACPSGVEYGMVLDYARETKQQSNYAEGFQAFFRKLAFKYLLPHRSLLSILRLPLLFLPKITKVQPRPKWNYKKLREGDIHKSPKTISGMSDDERTVSLHLGCLMDTIYNDVHWDTVKLLNAYGYHVHIAEASCCGALAHHSGEASLGEEQLQSSIKGFQKKQYPIVMNSAGCGAFLKEHSELPVYDIIEILNKPLCDVSFGINSQADSKEITATYHPACHLNHVQGLKTEYLDLLKQLPNMNIVPLYEADVCCGSAGLYNVIKSKMAEAIGERKAGFIEETKAKLVITANPGCMSQIQSHLPKDYKVVHPVSLLAECL